MREDEIFSKRRALASLATKLNDAAGNLLLSKAEDALRARLAKGKD